MNKKSDEKNPYGMQRNEKNPFMKIFVSVLYIYNQSMSFLQLKIIVDNRKKDSHGFDVGYDAYQLNEAILDRAIFDINSILRFFSIKC